MTAPDSDVLDEGLHRIARTGPEFGGGLSNHAPMAAEALVRLGRPDSVRPWLGAPRTAGRLSLAGAIGGLPLASGPPVPGLITEALTAGLAGEPRFAGAVAALRPPSDVAADLRDLAREFTRIFLAYGRDRPIALLHAVTAPVAARSALPLLPEAAARPTYDALWQVGAGLYAVYTAGVAAEPLPASAPPSAGAVTDQAVATGDEHAIKLTEACLRLHAELPDPLFLHAAARASELLR